jgi:hypothetical protein
VEDQDLTEEQARAVVNCFKPQLKTDLLESDIEF